MRKNFEHPIPLHKGMEGVIATIKRFDGFDPRLSEVHLQETHIMNFLGAIGRARFMRGDLEKGIRGVLRFREHEPGRSILLVRLVYEVTRRARESFWIYKEFTGGTVTPFMEGLVELDGVAMNIIKVWEHRAYEK